MLGKKAKARIPHFERPGHGTISAGAEILQQDAVRLFERVAEEVLHGDRELFDSLSPHERRVVVEWMSDAIVEGKAETSLHDVLWEIDHVRKPVGIETFIHDDFYFGRIAKELNGRWKEDLYTVFSPGSPIFEWVMCLSGDTRVPLLDGSSRSLAELHADFERTREPFWVYSYSKHGWVVPGRCTRVTKFRPDKLFKITLDDGTTMRANADHEFVCRDGVKRKVAQLKPGDRLMPFHTREQVMGSDTSVPYEQVYHPGVQRYEFTHQVVGRHVAGGKSPEKVNGQRATVHHKNVRHRDNRPENLEWMGWEDHMAWHQSYGHSPAKRAATSRRQSAACKDPASPIRRGHARFMASAAGRALAVANLSQAVVTLDEYRRRGVKGARSRWSDPTQRASARRRCTARNKGNTWAKLRKCNRRDVTVERIYDTFEAEGSLTATYVALGASRNAVVRVLRDSGLTIDDVKRGYRNHRIVSIEPDGVEPVYCLTVPQYENFALDLGRRRGVFSGNTGALGIGKTTLAASGICYRLTQLICLRDPASYYGLLPGSLVIFGVYSITKRQVADTGYTNIRGYIDTSPYFVQQFPRSTKIDSKIDFEPHTKRKLQVIPGSTELHALGLNLFAFQMDEVNFMRVKDDKDAGVMKGQAYDLYNATYTRLLSRFTRKGGTLPGMMFLLSSRNAQTSFLEEHLRRSRTGEHSHTTHVSDYALWEVKTKAYTWPGFKVEVGDRVAKSRLLKDGDTQRAGSRLVEVPWEYHKPFTEDVDQALRDIAGVATFNLSPLISDRTSIFDAISQDLVHPFSKATITIDLNDPTLIEDHFLLKAVGKIRASRWQPRLNPEAPRYIHVDIGLTNDSLGLAMSHVAGRVKNERVNNDGTLSVVSNPFIVVDLMVRIMAAPGGEVDLSKVRAFIFYLRNIGYPIARVTFDQFQSSDSIQILKKENIDSGHQSVDKDDTAYLSLRSAFFDRRVATYDYRVFQDEVLDLQRDIKKRKVDHPTKAASGGKGSKDVADAVAGSIWLCMNDERALHSTVADVEYDRTGAQRRSVAADMTIAAPPRAQLGGGVAWEELQANVGD
mgnify:CR=1 FL=1